MINERAKNFAIKMGGIGAKPWDIEWRGYAVYQVIPFKGFEGLCLGTPILLVVNEREVREATIEEVDAILGEMPF